MRRLRLASISRLDTGDARTAITDLLNLSSRCGGRSADPVRTEDRESVKIPARTVRAPLAQGGSMSPCWVREGRSTCGRPGCRLCGWIRLNMRFETWLIRNWPEVVIGSVVAGIWFGWQV